MKHILSLILTAVFLSVLSIPCAATDTGRTYPGFSDVAEGSASYEAIKLCYERGLMNGTSETSFDPQGKLNVAQLVVLAARLYDLQNGGDGTIPDPPDYGQPYLRFYDESGNKIIFFTMEEIPSYNAVGESVYIGATNETDGSELPESCKLEIGYAGYNHVKTFQGVRESHEGIPGAMSHGLTGTGYRFSDPDVASFTKFIPLPLHLEEAWWFPAVFYLGSEGVVSFDGELVYRVSGGNNGSGYDPLTRFSSDNASRSLFTWLVNLTAGELPVLNETVRIPDVNPDETQDAEAILQLYQAGILTGIDQAGTFHGSGQLTRAQAAMMLARVLEPSLRVRTG
nr:S-layer homology domain-containing protein [uncultured Oscillibacter sp.]